MALPKHLTDKIEKLSRPRSVERMFADYYKMKDGELVSDMNLYQCEGEIQRDVQMRSGDSNRGGKWQVSNIRLLVQDDRGKKLFISGACWDDLAVEADGLKQGTRVSVTGPLSLGREWTNREGVVQPAVPEILVSSLTVLGVRSGADAPTKVEPKVDAAQGTITFGD